MKPIQFRQFIGPNFSHNGQWHYWGFVDPHGAFVSPRRLNIDNFQFTGLHDKTTWNQLTNPEQLEWKNLGGSEQTWQGKEIWEGDIVRIAMGDTIQTSPMVVDMFNLRLGLNESDGYMRITSVEVLGNIHEHPYLLKTVQ